MLRQFLAKAILLGDSDLVSQFIEHSDNLWVIKHRIDDGALSGEIGRRIRDIIAALLLYVLRISYIILV